MKGRSRKEKIRELKELVSGNAPKRDPVTHIIDNMTTQEINALLSLKRDIKEGKRMEPTSNEELNEVLKSYMPGDVLFIEEKSYNDLEKYEPEDEYIILNPAPNCEPLEETSDFKAITATPKQEPTNESLNNETQQPKPSESHQETKSSKPVTVPKQKKEYSTFVIGGKLDETMTEYLKSFYGERTGS